MAEFTKLIITDKGKELLASVATSTSKVEFTRVSTSDRAYREEEIASLTDLAGIKQTNHISSVAVQAGGKIKIEAAFENRELTEGYFIKAIGIYAKTGSNTEVLYAVAIEKTGRYSIPAYNNATVSAVYLKLFLAVENFEKITLEVSPGAFITSSEIDRIKEGLENEHNEIKEELNNQLTVFKNEISASQADLNNSVNNKIDDVIGRITRLEDAIYNNLVGNSWILTFSDLDGVNLAKGNYNKAKQRLEC